MTIVKLSNDSIIVKASTVGIQGPMGPPFDEARITAAFADFDAAVDAIPGQVTDEVDAGFAAAAIDNPGLNRALESVTAASTANLALTGDYTVDDRTMTDGDRYLARAQTAPEENGVYIYNSAGAHTRATDNDAADEFLGRTVFVNAGTANVGKTYLCTSAVTTVGTTAVTWVEASNVAGEAAARIAADDVVLPRAIGLLTVPAATSPLTKIVRIEIFRAVGATEKITLPTLLCVREVARDGTDRFRFRLAEFDGTSTYTSITTEDNAGGGSRNVAGLTGYVWMDLLADGTSLGPADNAVIGRVLIDFGTGGTFGTYAGTIDYSDGGISKALVQSGPVFDADVAKVANSLASVATGSTLLITPPAVTSPLRKVLKIELFKTVGRVTLTFPDKMTIREIARDKLDRFHFRLAGYDGDSIYTALGSENNAGGAALDVAGFTGLRWLDVTADGTALGVPDRTVIGRVLIEFGAGGVFGTYASTISYADGGIITELQTTSPVFVSDVEEVVASLAEDGPPGVNIPFADSIKNKDLQRVVRDLWVMDGEQGEKYTLSSMAIENAGSGNHRLSIKLRAINRGVDVVVCQKISEGGTVADLAASIPEVVQFTDFLPSAAEEKTRATLQLTLDLTGITEWFQYGSTDYDVAGIHPSRVLTMDQQDDYLHDATVDQVIKVGTGQAFTTLDDALTSLLSFYTGTRTVNKSPKTDTASYVNRVKVYLTDRKEYTLSQDLPDYVQLDGIPGAVVRNDTPSSSGALQFLGRGKVENIKFITAAVDKYAVHMDSTNAPLTTQGQFTKFRKLVRNAIFEIPDGSDVDVLGGGVSSGEEWLVENLKVVGGAAESDTSAGIAIHNYGTFDAQPGTLPSIFPARVVLRGNDMPHRIGLRLYGVAAGPINVCEVQGNDFRSVIMAVNTADTDAPDLAADRYTWRMVGDYDGPVAFSDIRGQWVMQTTAGVAVSDTAADLIFGGVDDLGRGAKWVKDATTKSLGERLGDCSVTSKALTIGAETVTFTTDLTSATNTEVLDIINAAITTNPCSVVDITGETIADATPQSPVPSAAALFPKGRFMTRSAAGEWALAQPGERIEGWTWRAIPSGARGTVGTTKRIWRGAIEAASAATGDFGLAADGLLSFAATPKVGRVYADGTITVF